MLVLTRRAGQEIVIDGGITVTVLSIQGSKVRLGVQAPSSVRVDRREVSELRVQGAALSAARSSSVLPCVGGTARDKRLGDRG
jgi:carbon storage regulator